MAVSIIHVVSADTPASKLRVLDALRCRLDVDHRHTVVQVGGGPEVRLPGGAAIERVRSAFNITWLAHGRLGKWVNQCQAHVAHIWTGVTSACCPALSENGCRLLIELESARDVPRVARWATAASARVTPNFVCPTARVQRCLSRYGVPAERSALIREFVDFSEINRGREVDVRGPLDLSDQQRVVLMLPPVERYNGHLTCMWAALLVNVIRDDVRLLAPGRSTQTARLRRLAQAIGRERALRFPGDRFTLAELLGASDVAIYLPPDDAPTNSLIWAMASGKPILASATYAVAEMLADRHNAWLCRADDPKAAAAKLLRMIESPADSRDLIDRARTQAYEIFGRQRMLTQYARVYDNLVRDRNAGDGIVDSSVKGRSEP